MKKLLDIGNRYAKESTWKDFALVKFCLFSMGVVVGTQIPDKHKKKAIRAAACVFISTYVPLLPEWKKNLAVSCWYAVFHWS